MTFFLERFPDQIVCAILSCACRAVCVASVTCRDWKWHVTNNTTVKIIISVLFVNYSYGPGISRDIGKIVRKNNLELCS